MINFMYGIRIHEEAVIGAGLYIGHFGGIRIGICKIGSNCSINQQVVIGNNGESGGDTSIIIGDQVWIGAHTEIENSVVVENCATIGAGSIVKQGHRVHRNELVMGPDARVIKKNFDNTFLL
jgi:serine O-acetyltransferase